MDTKLKGWTAVRIICFILILLLCFTIFNRVHSSVVRYAETDVSPEIVLADLSTNQYFFEQHMTEAFRHASVLAYFGSEELIASGAHLMWVVQTIYNHPDVYYEYYYGDYWEHFDEFGRSLIILGYDEFGRRITVLEDELGVPIATINELWTPDKDFFYGEFVDAGHSFPEDHATRERLVQGAIETQLRQFRNAQDSLNRMEGLLYHISYEIPAVLRGEIGTPIRTPEELISHFFGDGNFIVQVETGTGNIDALLTDSTFSNVDEARQTYAFFRSQPVYFFTSVDYPSEQSHGTDFSFWSAYSSGRSDISLAFTQETVSAQNALYSAARNAYIIDFSIIAASLVLMLGLVVLLLVGAGRENKLVNGVLVRSDAIRFSPIDKPYLDISLAVIVCWTLLIAYFAFRIAVDVLNRSNTIAINLLLAISTLLIVPPILYWLMSFTKRIKAGRFWKHTLIYAIVYRLLFGSIRYCVRKVKSLWAGTRLTVRVALIGAISLCMMLIIGFIGAAFRFSGPIPVFIASLIFTAVVVFFLLRYAKRLHILEQGAQSASEGNYELPIDAGGGELGNIAGSINSISAGINSAVEERMKSERLKTELITNVSHDIRTPLTSIITYTDLLKNEGLDCERAPEYLDILIQKSQRLKTLTDELFEAAKAATGNIEVNLTELNIVSLTNQILGELDTQIKASGLDLRVNLPEKLHAKADGRLMQRVMENLLSNVFKYTLPGSRVYLDAKPVNGAFVQIDLKNVSAAELNFDPSELTERFKRGDDSRADGGSGLGLSIVQSFVSAQSGKFNISIDGDLFKATVLLPVQPPNKLP